MSEHYGLHLETGVIGVKGVQAGGTAPPPASVPGPDDEGGEPVREPDQEDDVGEL